MSARGNGARPEDARFELAAIAAVEGRGVLTEGERSSLDDDLVHDFEAALYYSEQLFSLYSWVS